MEDTWDPMVLVASPAEESWRFHFDGGHDDHVMGDGSRSGELHVKEVEAAAAAAAAADLTECCDSTDGASSSCSGAEGCRSGSDMSDSLRVLSSSPLDSPVRARELSAPDGRSSYNYRPTRSRLARAAAASAAGYGGGGMGIRVHSETNFQQAMYRAAKRLREECDADTATAAAEAAAAAAGQPVGSRAPFRALGMRWRRSASAASPSALKPQPQDPPALHETPPLAPTSPEAGEGGSEPAEGVDQRLTAPSNDAILASLVQRSRSMPSDVHPEIFLHGMLRERGYDTERRPALATPYHRAPTPDQTTAYVTDLVQAVRSDNAEQLVAMVDAGRRVDACNKYGESVLHMSCRRGNATALRALLRSGGKVAVSDDYGRTPLHDACWTPVPAFDVVTILLNHDLKLLRIADKRGSTPLQYIRYEHWPLWCAFFDSKKELYWRPLAQGEEDPDNFACCFGEATADEKA